MVTHEALLRSRDYVRVKPTSDQDWAVDELPIRRYTSADQPSNADMSWKLPEDINCYKILSIRL